MIVWRALTCIWTNVLVVQMVLLVGAVSSHKLVVSFCLGAELASDGRSLAALSNSVLVYSLGSSLGIVLGAGLDQWRTAVNGVSIPVLQVNKCPSCVDVI